MMINPTIGVTRLLISVATLKNTASPKRIVRAINDAIAATIATIFITIAFC
jgi:hypothetical protein